MAPECTRFSEPVWSHTRESILRACPRRYYYQYYESSGGASARAPAAARQAYRLKHLTTLDLVLGSAVHACAVRIARAVAARRARPSLEVLRDQVREALNRVWKSSRDRAAFLRDPRRHPMLLPIYYNRGVGPKSVERIQTKLTICLDNLFECPLWTFLERHASAVLHVTESPVRFQVGEIPAWAAPDLVFWTARHAPVVVEWKTGLRDPVGVEQQLAVYALFVRDQMGPPLSKADSGVVINLASGELRRVPLTDTALATATANVREGYRAMQQLLLPSSTKPLPIEAFPPTTHRVECLQCNFWEVCEPHLRSTTFV